MGWMGLMDQAFPMADTDGMGIDGMAGWIRL